MMKVFPFGQSLGLSFLKIGLLFLISSLCEVDITVVEKQVPDLRKEELKAVGESCPERIIADNSAFKRSEGDSAQISSNQVVLSANNDLSFNFAFLVKLPLANANQFSDDGLVLPQASYFNFFFQQFDQALLYQLLQ
jgi:hypothetical protein